MKSMRPEDRPKAIALSVGVVVVFVGIYMRLASALGGTPQPAPNAPVSENISGSGAGGDAAQPTPAPGGPPPGPVAAKTSQIDVPAISPTARQQDPFREPSKTAISSDVTSGPTPVASNPTSTKALANRARREGVPSPITEADLNSPTGPIGMGSKGGANSPASPLIGEIRADEPPPISVTGIVDGGGGRSVAVIRVGAKDYVVSTGDHFGNGFRLIEAYATTVVVTWSKEHRVERKKLSIELPGLSQDSGSGAL